MATKPFDFEHTVYDAIIVGGGPAGLTCAIFLARYRRRVLLVDGGRPRNYASRGVHGFLGQHGILPADLLKKGREEARSVGVEICDCTCQSAEKNGDVFEVKTTSGTMRGRRLVLAYGVRDELPDIPGIEDYFGVSVYHCPDCDGYEVSDKHVGVIGWGKRAVGLSLKLLQWTDNLTIFTHGHPRGFDTEMTSKLMAERIYVKEERIESLAGGGGCVESVVLDGGERVKINALFFSIGCVRTCGLAESLGCDVYEDTPNVVVDAYKKTTIDGVYAIGDLVPGSQLVITSAADGAIAAIEINKSLLPPSRLV